MDGIIGKFFFQFGITMSAAVLLSLLEAVTITPMRAAALLRNEPKVNRFEQYLDHLFEKFAHSYQKTLKVTLRGKHTIVIGSLVFFVASLFLITRVRQEFVPPQDQDFIIVSAQAAPGTSLETTSALGLKVEEVMKANKNVEGFFVSIGGGGGASSVNQIFLPVKLIPKSERKETHMQIMNDLRTELRKIKGLRISMRDISSRGLTSGRQNPVAINLRGPDLDVLQQKSDELIDRLEKEHLAVDLDTDFRKGLPELILRPNREAMAARGVSVQSVGDILAAGVSGLRQGRYTADGRRYDIRFKIEDDKIKSPQDFEKLYARNNFGNLVALSQLVDIKEQDTIQGINRVNRQRSISVFGNLAPGQSQSAVLDQTAKIAKEILPQGYSFALEGASAGFAQSFQSLYGAMLVGILVAYMILAVQFNSFIHPITVLVALPFSVTGALIALWMFDVSLNLFSFIGLIVLMGIAKKNSIMLVEFTNQHREQNKGPEEALLEACPIRLRPILMTSVATVAAATPLIFGHGIGSETRLPMGLAIIGGTIVSTILTLFVVPALYDTLVPLESKNKHVDL
jgi:multidrug efflux pump subunit AcrB